MSLAGMKILLAEDNPTNQMVAVQMLESLGADVTLAIDGAEALEIIHDRDFDVALIDIEMPRISGVDLIRQLRREGGRFADLPLIALTAYVMREHRAAIDEAGADGIIAKPILSIERFGEEIRACIKEPARTLEEPDRAPRTHADAGERATIDFDIFEQLCSAFEESRRAELLGKIGHDICVACEQIDDALDGEDFTQIRAASHVLISVAGTIGATHLESLSRCLNSAGHAADSVETGRIGPDLIAEASKVLEFIDGG